MGIIIISPPPPLVYAEPYLSLVFSLVLTLVFHFVIPLWSVG